MKRSGFTPKPNWKPIKRSTPIKASSARLKPVGARAKRTGQGKVKPTPEEKAWMSAVSQFCIVCHLHHAVMAIAEVHHLKQGDRRMGHLFSIGLCARHHRGGADEGPFISRHPWLKRFEAAYGTEAELLEQQKAIVEQMRAVLKK